MYRDPTLDEKPALLERRGGAFYSEAAAQLIASLHDGRGDVQVVDVATTGRSPTCPTTPWSRSRRGSTGTAPTRCARPPSPEELARPRPGREGV